jgi:hypothetical protein
MKHAALVASSQETFRKKTVRRRAGIRQHKRKLNGPRWCAMNCDRITSQGAAHIDRLLKLPILHNLLELLSPYDSVVKPKALRDVMQCDGTALQRFGNAHGIDALKCPCRAFVNIPWHRRNERRVLC